MRRKRDRAIRLERHRRWPRVDWLARFWQLDGQLGILLDRTAGPGVQQYSHSIHPRHGGRQKRRRGLGTVKGIVQPKRPFGISRGCAHGDIVRERDHRQEQDYQHQNRCELQLTGWQEFVRLVCPGVPRMH